LKVCYMETNGAQITKFIFAFNSPPPPQNHAHETASYRKALTFRGLCPPGPQGWATIWLTTHIN